MFVRRSRLSLAYSLPFLQVADPAGGNPPAPTPPAPPAPPEVKFDEAQQAKFNDAIAAVRKSTEDKVRADLEAASAAAKKKADEDREREEATKRGEFDTVRKSLEEKAEQAETALAAATTELETLRALATSRLTELTKDLPKEIADLGPAEDTPITTRLAWAEKAVKAAAKTVVRGNGVDPKATAAARTKGSSPISMLEIMNG